MRRPYALYRYSWRVHPTSSKISPVHINMECPICLEAYSRQNPARGPEECMPAACQHSICQQCCMRLVDGAWHPFKCPICRRDNSEWFKREFSFRNEPLCELEEFEEPEDLLAEMALREQLIASLTARYPNSGRNWSRGLPGDMWLLEAILDDLSLALGLR